MSRIGKQPINIPSYVTAKIDGDKIVIVGPKGSLEQKIPQSLSYNLQSKQLIINRKKNDILTKPLHGLIRSLIVNMIIGVTQGFTKVLEIQGTGYRVALEGEDLKLLLGFSHPVIVKPPLGIKFQVEGTNLIKISGTDKQLVGQVTARLREIRKVEPYKGKGIRYQGEKVRRKAGKTAKVGAA